MFQLRLDRPSQVPCKVLCLGAHSDDIEIGCGGTLLRLLAMYPNAEVWWVVFSAVGLRRREARSSAKAFLARASKSRVILKNFRESFLPFRGEEIKEFFEEIKAKFVPDVVLTHYRHDLHQDHRVVSEFTWNTFRNHLILEYEIPKYDGDLGVPNTFVSLDVEVCRQKVDNLRRHFASQRSKQWFTEDLFFALLRLRGVESNSLTKYAEAFYCRKNVL
ncbi:MAG: PIG-L family deacetylase [Nitrospira sp.]|nr:MAG: PIG-L family deacetylase [Nitrospira sp.]